MAASVVHGGRPVPLQIYHPPKERMPWRAAWMHCHAGKESPCSLTT